MSNGKQWRTWDEIEAEARADGRLDEAQVALERERMRAEQRAYRLAEIRKAQGLTQTDVAATMGVTQRRVSAVERGVLEHTTLGTVISYIAALGGQVEVVARFGDEHLVIADQVGLAPERLAEKTGLVAAIAPAGMMFLVEGPALGNGPIVKEPPEADVPRRPRKPRKTPPVRPDDATAAASKAR
jgi:transcriptional regulator with XRE-family HTH domain